MDGNNMQNGQNREQSQYSSNYQDNTANIPYQMPVENNVSTQANGFQITGLVCGILAIVSCCCYGVPSLILGIAGLICSILGNRDSKHGVGTAGLVCSIIGIILGIISIVFWIMIIISPEYQTMYNQLMREYYY